jgi:hypothetical protein
MQLTLVSVSSAIVSTLLPALDAASLTGEIHVSQSGDRIK